MTVDVANTEITNSIGYLINRVNELAYASTNKYVSVNSNSAYGNAAIIGTFSANSLVIEGGGQLLQNTSPTGNPTGGAINPTYATLVVQANTINANNRQFAAVFGLYSNTGRNATGNNKDNVTLYAGIVADANSGDVWSLNTVVTVSSGANTETTAYGYECDVNNMNGDRYTFDYPVYGIGITGASVYKSTTALLVGGVNYLNEPIWYRGITFVANSISMNTIEDQTNSNTSYLINGSHKYGIDMGTGVFANGAIRLPVGGAMLLNPNVNILYGDSANNIIIGRYGSLVISGLDGSVLVNTLTPGGIFSQAAFEARTSNSYGFGISAYHNNELSSSGAALAVTVANTSGVYASATKFYADTNLVGSIGITSSSVSYNTTSDYRLKQNVTPISLDKIELIDSLKMYEFNYINSETKLFGGLAHEMQQIIPSAVTGEKDKVYSNGAIDPQMVDYSKLIPLLVAYVQETRKELAELKLQIQQS